MSMRQFNPMQFMSDAIRQQMNPNAIMQQMAAQDPQAQQFLAMIRGKSRAELEQIARNTARERGTTLEAVAQQLGIPFGR